MSVRSIARDQSLIDIDQPESRRSEGETACVHHSLAWNHPRRVHRRHRSTKRFDRCFRTIETKPDGNWFSPIANKRRRLDVRSCLGRDILERRNPSRSSVLINSETVTEEDPRRATPVINSNPIEGKKLHYVRRSSAFVSSLSKETSAISTEPSSVDRRGAGCDGRFALMITKMKHKTTFEKTLLVHIVQRRVCYSCTFHGRKVKSYNDVLARCLSSEEKNRALTSFRSTNESYRTLFVHVQELLMNIFKVHQGRLTNALPPPWQRGTLFTRLVSAKYNRPHRLIG